jgi:hypothetical protein
MDMIRTTGKSQQKFLFQKCLPISLLSAAIIFNVSARADNNAKASAVTAPTTPATAANVSPNPTAAAAPAATNMSTPPAAPNKAVPAAAVEDTSIAQVIWVKGTVKATLGSAPPRVLARRSPLYAHDVLTTDTSGSGEVAFTDSSVLTLRESTEIRVDEYEFKKDPQGGGTGKEVMSLVKGGFRTITGAIPKANPDSYQVNTPVATIGVRGTDYSAYYSKEEGLMAKVFEGHVYVKNNQGLLELSKELAHLYAVVKIGEKPVVVPKEPAVFQSQTPPTPVTPSTINGIGKPGGGPAGGSKTVSSFCVGLLKDFTKAVHDFFS